MRRFALTLLLSMLLSGCTPPQEHSIKQYQATFLTLFDTVTTIVGYGQSEEEFHALAQQIHDRLEVYHRLFDIYTDYEGCNNLKTVNDHAGVEPVQVDEPVIRLLLDCKTLYEQTGGQVNVAMGSVLRLWHQAREESIHNPQQAHLPDPEALAQAANHVSFDTVIIDPQASTVYLSDPEQSLDVGAIAKGWAVEQVCQELPEGLLVSVGGNVRATGPRPTDGSPWVVGIQHPDGAADEYLHTLYVSGGSVVSSGDYQRYFTVDGTEYHHIIDPKTGYPAEYWRVVTILCAHSGLADALSTALFTLPLEEGKRLALQCGAEALWMAQDGTIHCTPGFEAQIRT